MDDSKKEPTTDYLVGLQLRQLRNQRGFSLRELAERSGLNINTLSLIENGKSSPSVSTLQQLARALEVPIIAFFEKEQDTNNIVITAGNLRPKSDLGDAVLFNLGKNYINNSVQPLIVKLNPGSGSGDQPIVHTGQEFVYCLTGEIRYRIADKEIFMQPEDSLLFEAHLPHCWENAGIGEASFLLMLMPADKRDEPTKRHFQ